MRKSYCVVSTGNDNQTGQISTFANAFTEQEAYAVEALSQCIQEVMSWEAPFYDDRAFGEDETEETYGMYNEKGGNYCT